MGGEELGTFDGILLDGGLGRREEGRGDGKEVSLEEGGAEGADDGVTERRAVVDFDGIVVKAEDGLREGEADKANVGFFVGWTDFWSDGAVVGRQEGAEDVLLEALTADGTIVRRKIVGLVLGLADVAAFATEVQIVAITRKNMEIIL